jgi:probable LLM family oxidoreductase
MQIGIDSFGTIIAGSVPAPTAAERVANLLVEAEVADRAGVDAFGIGEHHRAEFIESAPAVLLSAVATRTRTIRLQSAVTVLGADDPVRVFQDFATLDLISEGRAEIVAGRGSAVEAYPLFGHRLEDRDALYDEKLRLLMLLREDSHPHWSGQFRAPLDGYGIFPRPLQARLPLWVGVGGTPASFARAGALGLPLMIAIIGGAFARFRPLADLYRAEAARAGVPEAQRVIGVHAVGFVGATDAQARDAFFPGWHDMWAALGPERGWPPPTRRQFDALCAPDGPYIIGSPETVAAKLRFLSEALGGVSRVNLQMSSAAGDQAAMLESIALLGQRVKPLVG